MGLRQRIQHVVAQLSVRFDTGSRDEPQFTPVYPADPTWKRSDSETVSSFSATNENRRASWDLPPDYNAAPYTGNRATTSPSRESRPNAHLKAPSVTSVSLLDVSIRFVGENSRDYIRKYLTSIGSRLVSPDTPGPEVRASKLAFLSY